MNRTSRRSFLLSSAVSVAGVTGADKALAATMPDGQSADSEPTYRLTREIPAEAGFDLVVAGGGPAGTAAAVCAARLGAKALLVEATGCLGGMGTSGLVTAFDPTLLCMYRRVFRQSQRMNFEQ